MFRVFASIVIISAVAGCDPRPMTYAEALEICRDKSNAAAGPQGNIGLRMDANGLTPTVNLSISDSFLRGDDPQEVFDICMNDLSISGQIIGVTQ